jgi:hypothetical protein
VLTPAFKIGGWATDAMSLQGFNHQPKFQHSIMISDCKVQQILVERPQSAIAGLTP